MVTVRFVPVAFVNQRFVDETVPAVSQPVVVAFANQRLVAEAFATVSQPSVEVAFVKVMPVEETVVASNAVKFRVVPIPFVNVNACSVVIPAICRVEEGCEVPMPSQPSASSQNKSGVLDTVEVELHQVSKPAALPEPVGGAITVQMVLVGLQDGSKVSPGRYGGPAA